MKMKTVTNQNLAIISAFARELARNLRAEPIPVEVVVRKRMKAARHGAAGGRDDGAAARKNRARVLAAIRDLRNRHGLSVAKAIRRLRGNDYWSPCMKGVKDRSWASYFYEK